MLRLPRLQQTISIVDQLGRPTTFFQRLFNNELAQALEKSVAEQAATINQLQQTLNGVQVALQTAQAAQQAANQAQATADAGGGAPTARSGSNANTVNLTTTPIVATNVNLLTVSAGNLIISGTGPQQSDMIVVSQITPCTYNLIEVVGGVDTTVFTGFFTIYPDDSSGGFPQPPTVVHDSAPDVAAFSAARVSTGSVSYRVEIATTSGTASNLSFYMYVRRS